MNFETVATGSSPLKAEGYNVYKLPATKGRYVRVTGNGNSVNVNTNILELRVLGAK